MYNLQDELEHQFEMVFKLVEQAIDHGDAALWGSIDDGWSYAYRLFHLLESIDFYLHDQPQGFVFGGRLGVNSREMPREEYLKLIGSQNKNLFAKYLDEIRTATKLMLKLEPQILQSQDKFSEWGFKSRQHKFNYVLMHSTYHLGELSYHLKLHDMEHMKW